MGELYSNYLGFGKVVVPGLFVFVPNHPEIAQGKGQSGQSGGSWLFFYGGNNFFGFSYKLGKIGKYFFYFC